MKSKYCVGILLLTTLIALSGCGNVLKGENIDVNKNVNIAPDDDLNLDGKQPVAEENSHMNHTNSGVVPEKVKKAKNPTYPVGSQVTIQVNHMPGMKGAKGTIVGAFNTNAYTITYKPTTGDKEVRNHKWVIQEEIRKPQDKILQPGAKVTLEADHLPGMKGAIATIDSGIHTTVYMVNYKPANGNGEVKNHKWLTESEIEADQS